MEAEKIKELTIEQLDGVVGGVGNNHVKKPDQKNNVPLVIDTVPQKQPANGGKPEDSNPGGFGPFFG